MVKPEDHANTMTTMEMEIASDDDDSDETYETDRQESDLYSEDEAYEKEQEDMFNVDKEVMCENAEEMDPTWYTIPENPPPGCQKFVPFDVSLNLHPTIMAAATHEQSSQMDTFCNWPSWDPVYLIQGMMNGVFDFGVESFYSKVQEKGKKGTTQQAGRKTEKQQQSPRKHQAQKTTEDAEENTDSDSDNDKKPPAKLNQEDSTNNSEPEEFEDATEFHTPAKPDVVDVPNAQKMIPAETVLKTVKESMKKSFRTMAKRANKQTKNFIISAIQQVMQEMANEAGITEYETITIEDLTE
jgi:hypothetical protein